MNTGGPAFPSVPSDPGYSQWDQGMTLLDWYAGQALAGLLASPESRMPFDVVQRLAYDHAEAMLAEKARREAVVQESSTTQDDVKVTELQAANRELVEALDNLLAAQIDPMGIKAHKACKAASAIIAKHKGAA